MQNRKPLQRRLLAIYITFFVVIVASIAYNFIPDFNKGSHHGNSLGEKITANWLSGSKRSTFILLSVPVSGSEECVNIKGLPNNDNISITARPTKMDITVEQETPDKSISSIIFGVLGGSPYIYVITMIGGLSYIAIIIFMFLIIKSLRRSIKNELLLDKHNILYTRLIGWLLIFSELCQAVSTWYMNSKAAELLASTNVSVETTFPLSYWNILMGVLVLFTAEVFSIGSQLSEEQQYTI